MMWNFKAFSKDIVAITEDERVITYSELQNLSDTLLENISERCLVFNLCTNTLGSLLGYVSFINNNIVPLMLDVELNKELLDNLITTYKPAYLWVPQKKATIFSDFTVVCSIEGYSLLKSNFSNSYKIHEDVALLLTTSGSTGSFKLVKQSYKNIKSNMMSIVEYLNLDKNERPITTLPMSYTYGLSIINSHLTCGASIILNEKTLMQKEFWATLKKFEATSFGGVPYIYEMLYKLRFFRMDLPKLKTMTQAGGKLSFDLHEKFAKFADETGKKFIVMYGQTEATARMSYLPFERSIEKAGSIGIAIPGGNFDIVDTDGNPINEPNTVGELRYIGENVTLGYAESSEDLEKGDERNGMLVTGDMAKFDEDNYFYIVGRKKRFLKIYGSRVNLDETEQLIKQYFNGIDCVCAGIDDALYVFILDVTILEDVSKFIHEKTSINRAAVKVKVISEIPRSESGKILYPKLDQYYD